MIYLALYIGTICLTFITRGVNKFLLIKDLASRFYKVDVDALRGEKENIDYFNFRKIDFKSFIPFYNVFKAVEGLIDYCNNYDDICDDLEDLGVVYSMANFEIYEYRQNPSILNLFKVLRNGRKRLLNANYFEAIDNEGMVEAQVFYEGSDDITILDLSGKFDGMLTSEIIDVLKTNDAKGIFSNFIHESDDKITVARNTSERKNIDDKKGLSAREKITILEALERELMETKKDSCEEAVKQKVLAKNVNNKKNY